MGLAASQARFLCITARKADCEYKSTELAQQKLEITNKLSDISNAYSQSLNATKLVWQNSVVDDKSYGLSYGMLMTPSQMNDYRPCMITTSSGAIVLNSEYANAARKAGLNMAGGSMGSADSREKFIRALAGGDSTIITQGTVDAIFSDKDGIIAWNQLVGRGEVPTASGVTAVDYRGLIFSEEIGMKPLDWGKLVVPEGGMTLVEYNETSDELKNMIRNSNANKQLSDTYATLQSMVSGLKLPPVVIAEKDGETKTTYKWKDTDGKEIKPGEPCTRDKDKKATGARKVKINKDDKPEEQYKKYLYNAYAQAAYMKEKKPVDKSDFDKLANYLRDVQSSYKLAYGDSTVSATSSLINNFDASFAKGTITVVENNVVSINGDNLDDMTIGDLLKNDVVLVNNGASGDFKTMVQNLFDSIVTSFGYDPEGAVTGVGLNYSEETAAALDQAYKMMASKFYTYAYKENLGEMKDSPAEDKTYKNALLYNGFVFNEKSKNQAVSISNLISTFLTYFENALNGADSMNQYYVGATTDTSNFVTDDPTYQFVIQNNNKAATARQKSAEFFDMLYNNILERGWREDVSIADSEYMVNAIKNGNYFMSSLNNNGYYYQSRYNDIDYVVEQVDSDAIARAEAEFAAKKAELTYKEDTIDLKTKQLDAEIAALTTEYDSVKQLISNSISKTFSLFQN